MLEITTHQFPFFTRKEFWFYNSEKITKGTYNVFCLTLEKETVKKKNVLIQQTSLIDLVNTEEKLFNAIHKTFKLQIKRAEKTGITSVIDFDPALMKCKKAMAEFSEFAKHKSIEWNPRRIIALQKIKRLIISEAYLNDELLVTHMYLHDTDRVILLHSFSAKKNTDKKLQGYANKYLHWKELVEFKKYGLKIFDFGGINLKKHPGISAFKLSFGGNLIDSHSYIESSRPVSFFLKLLKR